MLRFAPSPLEALSVSTLRVALVNYILSRQKQEQFIVRMDAIDEAAQSSSRDQEILDLLKKFAIEQEQLFYQQERLGRHQQFALSLLAQGKAFACTCQAAESSMCQGECLDDQERIAARIKAEKIPYLLRLKRPKAAILFHDKIAGEIQKDPDELGEVILLKTDGTPTQAFATACDDMLEDISLVIREEKYLDNTPAQIHIKHSLGYTAQTSYAHLPEIKNLSDNKEALSITWLLTEGFLPDAIINYLLNIGIESPAEIFTLPDTIAWFSLEKCSSEPAPFDIEKLRHINRRHLEAMEENTLSRIFGFADADIGRLLKLYLEEASTLNALQKRLKAIFSPKSCETHREMQMISTLIQEAPMFHDFGAFMAYLSHQSGMTEKALLLPLRLLMTGAPKGPKLEDIYPLVKPYITEIARCTS